MHARRAKVLELYDNGMEPKQITAAIGVSHSTIISDLKALGRNSRAQWEDKRRERQAEKMRALYLQKKGARNSKCSTCGGPIGQEGSRFRGNWYCGGCIVTVGEDPDYYARRRREILEGGAGFSMILLAEEER